MLYRFNFRYRRAAESLASSRQRLVAISPVQIRAESSFRFHFRQSCGGQARGVLSRNDPRIGLLAPNSAVADRQRR